MLKRYRVMKRIPDHDERGTVDVEHSQHTFNYDAQTVAANLLALHPWIVRAWVEEIVAEGTVAA